MKIKRKLKELVAVICILAITINLLPIKSAFIEAETIGKWTDSGNYNTSWFDPMKNHFEIFTASQLAGVAVLVNNGTTNFTGMLIELKRDIDLGGKKWVSIGFNTPYRGNFDGNNHTISNMDVDTTGSSLGFFMGVSSLVSGQHTYVQNITFSNAKIDTTISSKQAGILAGYIITSDGASISITNCVTEGYVRAGFTGGVIGTIATNTNSGLITIENCKSNSTIVGLSNNSVGGIIGNVDFSNANNRVVIDSCEFDGTISANYMAGGILGGIRNIGYITITNSISKGSISVTGAYAGGILSRTSNSVVQERNQIINCINYADVTGYHAGGIVGETQRAVLISQSFNSGSIRGYNTGAIYGGIVGRVGTSPDALIEDCYNTGTIYANVSVPYIGGIAGYNSGIIKNSYNRGNLPQGSATRIVGAICSINYKLIVNTYFLFKNEEDKIVVNNLQQGEVINSTSLSVGEFKNPSGIPNWDFDNVWEVDSRYNNGFPIIRALKEKMQRDPNPFPISGNSVHVYELTGGYKKPISNATLTFEENVYEGSNSGQIQYSIPKEYSGDIVISKEGYISRTFSEKEIKTIQSVCLVSESDSTPVVYSVLGSNSLKNYDLYSQKMSVALYDNNYKIKADVIWPNNYVGKVYMQNGQEKIAIDPGKWNEINPESHMFLHEKFFIVAISPDGSMFRREIKLTKDALVVSPSDTLSFSSFNLMPDIEIFNSSSYEFKLYGVDMKYEVEGNKYKLTIGVGTEEFDTVKSLAEKAKRGVDILKTAAKTKSPVSFGSKFDANASVLGYAEGFIKNGVPQPPISSGLIIKGEAKVGGEYQTFISVIPVVYGWEISIEGKAQLDIIDVIDGKPAGIVKLKGAIEVHAGVGVAYIASVGFAVEGSMNADHVLGSQSYDAYFTMDFKGYIKALGWKQEYSIIKATWPSDAIRLFSQDMGKQELFTPMNREYTKYDSTFLANNSLSTDDFGFNLKTYTTMSSSISSQLPGVETFVSNIFSDSTPVLVNIGESERLAVWVEDAGLIRTMNNRAILMYSYFDGNTWSHPQPVNDTGTNDFRPEVLVSGEKVYIGFLKSNNLQNDEASFIDIASSLEIMVAEFENGVIGEIYQLTDNEYFDGKLSMAGNNGKIAVTWSSNTDNEILGQSNKDMIYRSFLEDGIWSEPEVLADTLSAVYKITSSFINDVHTVVYSSDYMNENEIESNTELFVISGNEKFQLTSNDVIDNNPTFDENGILYWYRNGQIYILDDLTNYLLEDIVIVGNNVSDNFKVMNNNSGDVTLIWNNFYSGESNLELGQPIKSELYGIYYDPSNKIWSNTLMLTNYGMNINQLNGYMQEDGTLKIMANIIEPIQPTADNLMGEGQCDLSMITIAMQNNLTIGSTYSYDESALFPGKDIIIAFDVTNSGTKLIEEVDILILNENGETILSNKNKRLISQGETVTLSVAYYIPQDWQDQNFTIRVLPSGNQIDVDLSDNDLEIFLQYNDLAVSNSIILDEGNYYRVAADITNFGFTEKSDIFINLRNETQNGEIIETIILDSISSRTKTTVEFFLDKNTYPSNTEIFFVEIEPIEQETFISNNIDYVMESKKDNDNIFEVLISDIYEGTVEVIVTNISNTLKSGKLYLVVDNNTYMQEVLIDSFSGDKFLFSIDSYQSINFTAYITDGSENIISSQDEFVAIGGVAIITGSPKFGEIISVDTTGIIPETASFDYQWQRNDIPIYGEINSTYTIQKSDIGQEITVSITGTENFTGLIKSNIVVPTKADNTTISEIPILSSKTTTSVTLFNETGFEYKLNDGEWQSIGMFDGLEPNTEYTFYQRIAETDTHFAGEISEGLVVKTNRIEITGEVAIAGTYKFGEELTADITEIIPIESTISYQWNRNGVEIPAAINSTYKVTQADIGQNITVTVTGTGDYTGVVNSIDVIPGKADGPMKPSAPTIVSKTSVSVTLLIQEGYEYRIEDGQWQTSGEFTGLSPDTTYTFYSRIAETDTHGASISSYGLEITTDNYLLGDINNDGRITTVDALMALQAASGRITLTDQQKLAADVNKDGRVTTVDALMILQYASGRIISFG